jgi:hypothetical protein
VVTPLDDPFVLYGTRVTVQFDYRVGYATGGTVIAVPRWRGQPVAASVVGQQAAPARTAARGSATFWVDGAAGEVAIDDIAIQVSHGSVTDPPVTAIPFARRFAPPPAIAVTGYTPAAGSTLDWSGGDEVVVDMAYTLPDGGGSVKITPLTNGSPTTGGSSRVVAVAGSGGATAQAGFTAGRVNVRRTVVTGFRVDLLDGRGTVVASTTVTASFTFVNIVDVDPCNRGASRQRYACP